MGPADLDDLVELGGLGVQGLLKGSETGLHAALERQSHRNVHGRWESVVGTLNGVVCDLEKV